MSTDCAQIEGNVVIRSNSDTSQLDQVDGCFNIEGNLFVQQTDAITDLSFLSGLRSIQGYVGIAGNDALVSVSMPQLETLDERLHIENNDVLEQVLLPMLTSAGSVSVRFNPMLDDLTAPRLGGG